MQQRYQNILWELARHCIGEEIIVYPAMEAYLTDGLSVVARHRAENQKVRVIRSQSFTLRMRQLTSRLVKWIPYACCRNLGPGMLSFFFCVQTLFTDLEKRLKEEESKDLIRLEDTLHWPTIFSKPRASYQ